MDSAKREDGMPASAVERQLRRMLCAAHCGVSAYMDDGEASDSSMLPHIDFMRMTPSDIQAALLQRGMKKLEALQVCDHAYRRTGVKFPTGREEWACMKCPHTVIG
jgi:hypothetical protein